MKLVAAAKTLLGSRTVLACGAAVAALGALALVNRTAARRAECEHPPRGTFLDVDGVRLHYTDRGVGQPIVLIHGNVVSGDDYDTSGVVERLLETHRVIIFDRPGFGHSERPRRRIWTATQQAELLHKALK
ncbi:alpha/beta hydrolase fold [Belnapia rosea]|uniref:Alpha/beta hydrolase fold n=1 Tax=Belnapia rosea TaxID=938405 RepID=A0A1G7D0G0_9PROT|nr:alpha/beta hydrolase fold [Belnapia rosea]